MKQTKNNGGEAPKGGPTPLFFVFFNVFPSFLIIFLHFSFIFPSFFLYFSGFSAYFKNFGPGRPPHIIKASPYYCYYCCYCYYYAQTLILVTCLLVNCFLGFSVISRDHGSFEGRHLVEMNPTSLPELSKPSRDLLELRKAKFVEAKIFRETVTATEEPP